MGGEGGHGFPPYTPLYNAQLQVICAICKKSMGAGVVTTGAGGLVANGPGAWEPIEGRQLDSPNPLVQSNPHSL